MRSKVMLIGLLGLLSLGSPLALHAQFQRMGIARGSLSIAARSAGEVATYCLDYTRKTPHPNVAYNNVLSGRNSARVSFNGQTMSLQEAIAAGMVRVHGASVSLSELVSAMSRESVRYPPEQRERVRSLAGIWARLSPEGRAAIEREYAPSLAGYGDFEHLQFENPTPFPMKVTFDGAVLGVEDEGLPAVVPSSIPAAYSLDEQRKLQTREWQRTTRHTQALLKAAHTYAGPLDGETSPEPAIKMFQERHSLEVTGKLDANTDSLLRGTADQQWVSGTNSTARHARIATITVKRTPDKPNRYSVFSSALAPDYEGNDVRQIAAALRKPLNDTADTLYLNLEGFSDANREDFASSIRIQRDLLGEDVSIALPPRRGNGDIESEFFRRGIRIEKLSRVEEVAAGPNKGRFQTTIDVAVNVIRSGVKSIRRFTVTILSSSREALVSALALLHGEKAALAFDDTKSLAEVVAMTRGKIRKLHPDLKNQDFHILFRNETGLSQMVLLHEFLRSIPNV